MKWFLVILYSILSIFLLYYMITPGPDGINDFPDLPSSVRSDLDGDVWQVPDVAGYFSSNYRDYAISYYQNKYSQVSRMPFKPIRLIHPPEYAYTYIKDQTQSTYLEELLYPLRDSLYINGLEPFDEDGVTPRYEGAIKPGFKGNDYLTKVTVRFYPSAIISRIIVWAFINLSFYLLFYVSKKVLFGQK